MPADASLASLSDNLLVFTLITYTLAMFMYGVEYAFGARGRIGIAAKGAKSERVLAAAGAATADAAAGSSSTATITESVTESDSTDAGSADSGADKGKGESAGDTAENRSRAPIRAGRIAVVLTILGLLLHIGVLVTRGFAAQRVPWGNMYEYGLTACMFAVVAWLVVLARQPAIRHLGTFAMLAVVLLLGASGTVLYTPIAPLVPALNSYWIWIHVSAATLATGMYMLAMVTSVLYLIRDAYDRRISAGKSIAFPLTLGPRLPSADGLERTTFRVIAFGFPVWTFAIICGAIWAEAAWSRFWGWDPKETWSFITWVIYAAYLHARATAGWRGRKAIWIALLGFVALMVNLFGVNLVISGLHSYAGLQ